MEPVYLFVGSIHAMQRFSREERIPSRRIAHYRSPRNLRGRSAPVVIVRTGEPVMDTAAYDDAMDGAHHVAMQYDITHITF